jgi:hypothetical protein
MWAQWLLKSQNGTGDSNDLPIGPAPPAAVAAASKIAFSSLGSHASNLLRTEDHKKSFVAGTPVDSAGASFLERTDSGTLSVPLSSMPYETGISDFTDSDTMASWLEHTMSSPPPPASVRSLVEDNERRNLNLRWLRVHFRFLNDVGRLPFHNADLWQLHQYFFSPPSCHTYASTVESTKQISNFSDPSSIFVPSNSRTLSEEQATLFQEFADSLTGVSEGPSQHGMKRSSRLVSEEVVSELGPLPKKAKCLTPRIEYYPRVMVSENWPPLPRSFFCNCNLGFFVCSPSGKTPISWK